MATKTIQGVTMSTEAARNVEECSVDVRDDVARLATGATTFMGLLAECLDGADADRETGWREYVDAVYLAADWTDWVDLDTHAGVTVRRAGTAAHVCHSHDGPQDASDEEVARWLCSEFGGEWALVSEWSATTEGDCTAYWRTSVAP